MKTLKTCEKGHKFYKSSDCPICPVCEAERKPKDGFLSLLPAPARRALENNGIFTLEELAKHSEKEILKFHGMGKGKKLFDNGSNPAAFTLIESAITPSGVIIANYKRAGKVKTGTVGA